MDRLVQLLFLYEFLVISFDCFSLFLSFYHLFFLLYSYSFSFDFVQFLFHSVIFPAYNFFLHYISHSFFSFFFPPSKFSHFPPYISPLLSLTFFFLYMPSSNPSPHPSLHQSHPSLLFFPPFPPSSLSSSLPLPSHHKDEEASDKRKKQVISRNIATSWKFPTPAARVRKREGNSFFIYIFFYTNMQTFLNCILFGKKLWINV